MEKIVMIVYSNHTKVNVELLKYFLLLKQLSYSLLIMKF